MIASVGVFETPHTMLVPDGDAQRESRSQNKLCEPRSGRCESRSHCARPHGHGVTARMAPRPRVVELADHSIRMVVLDENGTAKLALVGYGRRRRRALANLDFDNGPGRLSGAPQRQLPCARTVPEREPSAAAISWTDGLHSAGVR